MRSRLTSTARPPAASLGALRPDGLKVRSRSERQRKTTHQRRGTAVKAASQAPRTLGSEWVWALARDSLYWSSTTAGMRPLAGTSMPCSVAQERVAFGSRLAGLRPTECWPRSLGGSNAGRGPRERRPNACRAPLRARSSCASTDRALAIPAKTDGLDRVRSIEIIDEHFYGCFRHCLPSGGTSGQQDTLATDATHPGLPLAQRDDAPRGAERAHRTDSESPSFSAPERQVRCGGPKPVGRVADHHARSHGRQPHPWHQRQRGSAGDRLRRGCSGPCSRAPSNAHQDQVAAYVRALTLTSNGRSSRPMELVARQAQWAATTTGIVCGGSPRDLGS
jgi:hypothetical protein